ncbi:MAG: nitroreductase family protein [Anaerolineales bacterium]|nr:nitroreductase family protein [Anaerolineales bacterium]
MMMEELTLRTRSFRRFQQDAAVEIATLRALVNLARQSASASNMQPLKYILCSDPQMNAAIFPHLGWAGYLKGWGGPKEGERPAAYIIILGDTTIRKDNFATDCGIAAQSIMLGATERGLGGCMLGSVDRNAVRELLHIPAEHEIVLVLALGAPAETVVLEDTGPEHGIKYYRDEHDVHHVPKRPLAELIAGEYGA